METHMQMALEVIRNIKE
jgi:hypothetical protein